MRTRKHLRALVGVILLLGSICTLQTEAARRPRGKSKPQAAQPKAAKPANFKPSCITPSFPSPAPTAKLDIDSLCGVAGSGTGAEAQQNMAKNNFCAKGAPKLITIADLKNLQAQVEKNKSINFGDENTATTKKGPAANRAPLRKLGEGRLVTLQAYVLIARQEGGESVNCGKNVPNHPALHDIHISLVESKEAPPEGECAGVVAEMSPHRRPDAWNHANVDKVQRAQLPVRVTGQLYFDSSHFPCNNGQGVRSNPKRLSLWEIHPVYKFEVCTSANCADASATWLPLDQWAQQQ